MNVSRIISGWLYTGGIHIYQGILKVAAARHRKARLMMRGRRGTMDAVRRVRRTGDRWIWLHAASLGEFEQGRPLMERVRREHPELKIALSFYSPSGYEVRKSWDGADMVVYMPADTPRMACRFLDALRPEAAVFVKYEFWGNFLSELRRRDIPAYIISAVFREGQPFFRPWGGYWRGMLCCFTHLFVQDEDSRRLLSGIGLDNVTVAGDTRFDRVTDIMRGTSDIDALERFTCGRTRLTLIYGSSWEADEDVYFPWLRQHAAEYKAKIIIAPHEFGGMRLERMRARLEPALKTVFMSEAAADPSVLDSADCLIMDCFGMLSSAYRYACIAYVGGGFGAGIHNINEAAVYGIPVVYGPRHDKFIEASELAAAGGGFPIGSRADYAVVMSALSDRGARAEAGRRAGEYIASKLGATDKVYRAIFSEGELEKGVHAVGMPVLSVEIVAGAY